MKKVSILRGMFALLALGSLCATQIQAESIKEDPKCCMPGSVFCLAEKTGSDSTFFLSEEARKDLGLTEEQVTKIRALVKKSQEEIQKECEHLKRPTSGATKEECAEFRKEMKQICEKHYPKCMEELKKILSPEQFEKMQTRIFQYYGFAPCPMALAVLGLNETQKNELFGLCERTCEKVHALCNEKSEDGAQAKTLLNEKMMECRKACAEEVKSILTKEQLAKGERLLGEVPSYVQKMKSAHEYMKTASLLGNKS